MKFFEKFSRFFKEAYEVAVSLHKKHKKPTLFIFFDIVFCALVYKSSPKNYEIMGFINLKAKQRKTFLTFSYNNKLIKKYNSREAINQIKDKYTFAQNFPEFHRRKRIQTCDLTYETFLKFAENESKLIYKPIQGAKGSDIKVIKLDEVAPQLFEKIKQLRPGVLESWIVQHPDLNKVYSRSVNCIRIKTVLDNGVCHITEANISFGNHSYIANFCANSLFTIIDIKTGIIKTDACDESGAIYEKHPETGAVFKGFQIPYWQETLEMLEKAAKKLPKLGYIGWDVAIAEDSPLVIEANHDPGYTVFQYPLFTQGTGSKSIYAEFLK